MISTVLESREYEVQTYRSCVGILNLEKKYGTILEQACKEANSNGLRSYKAVNAIAKTLKDATPERLDPRSEVSLSDENLSALYCVHKQEVQNETF
jgi:TRAP-type mannitol/chloroaromatic compound transport system substrate-binding protein